MTDRDRALQALALLEEMDMLDEDVFDALAAFAAGRRLTRDQTEAIRHARARLGRLVLAAGGVLPEVA